MRGLYLHIPFCSVKCFYCGFTAFAGQRSTVQRYIAALKQETLLRPRLPVDTLYVGGGTPSELSAEELRELFQIIETSYRPVREFLESTIEANPESLTREKLEVLAGVGVSRLSLGLQTMEPKLLKEIGRRHSVEQFLEAYREARRHGFAINVDLMTGLPTQMLEDSSKSLDAVLALEPEHISLYGLSVEDRTLFAKRGIEVDEDLDREMYERALDRLGSAGYVHYEISNFSRPGRESVHNQIYWVNGEYIGIGCGASGNLNGLRYSNKDRLQDYCAAVERTELPQDEAENLAGKEKLGETLLLGLRRLAGIELAPEMESVFAAELLYVENQGWVERDGRVIRLTRAGLFLANRVFEEFVAPFHTAEVASR